MAILTTAQVKGMIIDGPKDDPDANALATLAGYLAQDDDELLKPVSFAQSNGHAHSRQNVDITLHTDAKSGKNGINSGVIAKQKASKAKADASDAKAEASIAQAEADIAKAEADAAASHAV